MIKIYNNLVSIRCALCPENEIAQLMKNLIQKRPSARAAKLKRVLYLYRTHFDLNTRHTLTNNKEFVHHIMDNVECILIGE